MGYNEDRDFGAGQSGLNFRLPTSNNFPTSTADAMSVTREQQSTAPQLEERALDTLPDVAEEKDYMNQIKGLNDFIMESHRKGYDVRTVDLTDENSINMNKIYRDRLNKIREQENRLKYAKEQQIIRQKGIQKGEIQAPQGDYGTSQLFGLPRALTPHQAERAVGSKLAPEVKEFNTGLKAVNSRAMYDKLVNRREEIAKNVTDRLTAKFKSGGYNTPEDFQNDLNRNIKSIDDAILRYKEHAPKDDGSGTEEENAFLVKDIIQQTQLLNKQYLDIYKTGSWKGKKISDFIPFEAEDGTQMFRIEREGAADDEIRNDDFNALFAIYSTTPGKINVSREALTKIGKATPILRGEEERGELGERLGSYERSVKDYESKLDDLVGPIQKFVTSGGDEGSTEANQLVGKTIDGKIIKSVDYDRYNIGDDELEIKFEDGTKEGVVIDKKTGGYAELEILLNKAGIITKPAKVKGKETEESEQTEKPKDVKPSGKKWKSSRTIN